LITSSNETSKQGLKNYQFRANSQSNAPIWLLEYSNKGTEKWYGPFAVNASVGEKITATKIAWQRESSPEQNSIATTELAIAVTQTGMQRIHYADLVDAGLDLSGKRPSQLAIALGEQSIAIYINGDPEVFNNQSSFDFYAENIDSLYTNSRIYHLSFKDKEQKLIAVNSTVATTSHDAWHWQSLKYNPNVIYDFSSASADPWRAETLATFANSSFNKPFQLSHVLDNSSMTTDSNIQLRVKLSGAIDYQQPPEINPTDENRCGANAPDLFLGMPNDHCLQLTVNDHQYAEIVFDGLRNNNSQYSIDVNDLEQELLLVGLDLPGQTGYDYDIVNIEEISIKYPRQLYAKNNLLDFSIANSKTFESDIIYEANFESNPSNDEITNQGNNKAALVIKGFSNENIVAYALDRNHPKRIAFVAITESMGQFNAKIPAIANSHHYWVSTEEAMLKPQLQAWKQGSEFNPEGVEYIIIAHEDFIQGSQRIKAHHQAHGLNTAIINVNDIYAKYSASVIDPYAIKAFIAELSKNNSLKYILLVGSDNYDYKGYLSDTHFSHIPSIYTAIDDVVRHAPADSLYADIDA
ncbi:MAG TPA: hypothetical protein ENJ41_04705, partial [Oceanospirillales bacterium]|nr:hypothetical protein [Oceanospirillales bacterium]